MANPTYLSNLSYVNKDFQSIYVELLDLVKKLTYRWEPSISNESDPGVLLIKLMAICADKNNYTSDKNVLECFPESVTEEPNARQLFEQLGYTMHWYRAAETEVSLRWIGDESIYSYKVPRFTMVSNDTNSLVYTLVEERELTGDGATFTERALQGVAEIYSVNGEELITAANLDANNRLYFPDRNVAENGVFICNADSTTEGGRQENYDSWVRKTNLAVEPLGQYCYKFGVANDGESCYIEFPSDVQSLMGEGIYITYIRTDGEDGNISAKVLEKFYNDVTITNPEDPESSLVLDSNNVLLTNLSSATNGYNPESIDSAYRNYKKTVGTFNTLVTLRDYANAIIESGMVSNAFVCDRTNDVQVSYSVLSTSNDVTHYVTCVETDENDEPLMEAFDLKMFLLQNVDRPSSADDYNGTFVLVNNVLGEADPVVDNILSYINDLKSVQHDFQPIIKDKIAMFINKYVVDCKIIPQYRVTSLQEEDIRKRIQQALYTQLNSKMIEFGEEITYSEVYDIIINADERIKAITLDTLNFTTYAVYFKSVNGSTEYVEVPLSDLHINNVCEYDATTDTATFTPSYIPVNGEIYYATNTHTAYLYSTNTTPRYTPKPELNFGIDIYAKSILHGNTPLTEKVDDFLLAYNQEAIETVSGVERVTTDTKVVFNAPAVSGGNARAEATLRENEVMQFYAPSLIDKLQYSTSVKYQFQLADGSINVPSNSDFTLGELDSLVLYWKNSDDEYDYNYYKYGAGTIVHTTFPVQGPMNLQNYTGTNLDFGRGTTLGAYFPYTEEGVTQQIPVTSYVETKMNGSQYFLTTSKTVTIRDKNRLPLESTKYKCYWKLNSKTGGMYELFPEGAAGTTQSYLLQNGEYFFYTNYDETMLAYWGEGTRIERICEELSPAMVCEVTDISAFQQDGLKSFESYWVMLGSTYTIVGEETQFISLGEGCKVIFTGKDGNAFNFDVTYSGIHWNGGDSNIDNYVISYWTPEATEPTTLPKILIDGGWDCRAVLNFVPTPTTPQKLLSDQTIKYYTSGSMTNTIEGDTANPIYVLADYAYSMDGGQNIDVTRINANGDTIYAELYWYRSTSANDANVAYMANGSVRLTFNHSGDTLTLQFKFPYDDYFDPYFLPLHNSYSADNVTSLTATLGNSDMQDLFGRQDFAGVGDYYLFAIGANFTETATMTITATYNGDGSRVFTLRPPYRVKIPDALQQGKSYNAVYDKVLALDTKKAFDYTYQVAAEDLIENPLDPESFLNPKHIFNPFTICQMDTSKLSIFITNKIK